MSENPTKREIESRPHPARVNLLRLRVLVADDEPAIRDLLEMFLNRQGHTVKFAENGRDALRQIVRSNFDLIISDQNMPLMSGTQLAEAIQPLAIPFILLTGLDPRIGENCRGIAAVLQKPVSQERLGEGIRTALEAVESMAGHACK